MSDVFIIKEPHIAEKATALNAIGKYVFLVAPGATKQEVKKAVKELYRVDATAVNIVNLPGKTRRYRGKKGKRSGVKKAVVTLKEGQKIDIGR